jgi:hypothetical protein
VAFWARRNKAIKAPPRSYAGAVAASKARRRRAIAAVERGWWHRPFPLLTSSFPPASKKTANPVTSTDHWSRPEICFFTKNFKTQISKGPNVLRPGETYQSKVHCMSFPARASGPRAAHVSHGLCPLPAPRVSCVICLESGTHARALGIAAEENSRNGRVGAILQNSNAASKARRYRAPRRCARPCATSVRSCIPPARPRVRALVRIPAASCIRAGRLVPEKPRRLRGPGRRPTCCGVPRECAVVGRRSRTAGSAAGALVLWGTKTTVVRLPAA